MASTPDAYGKPVYGDGFELPGDLQSAADFADTFANVRRGTESDRNNLLSGQLRDGMLFTETDTGIIWQRHDGGWVPVVEDTGWIDATMLNGWSASGGQTVQYRRKNGVVKLRGRASGGSTNAAFQLPAGFRPTIDEVHAVISGASNPPTMCRVAVGTDGNVGVITGTQPNFHGVGGFPADA